MEQQHPVNEGVVIGGEARVSGPVAGGRYARAEQHTVTGGDTAQRTLADLRAAVQRHRAEVSDPDLVVDDLDDLGDQLGRSRPDRDRVVAALQRVTSRVAAVGAAAAAVAKLHEILTS